MKDCGLDWRIPPFMTIFTGHKVGDMVELMGKEWKIEDVIFGSV